MSDITVRRSAFLGEDRSWLKGPSGVGPGDTPSATLNLALFTAGTHYPKGFIPSGIVLGRVTASRLCGPYDPAANDGRETAVGHLFGSLSVPAASGVIAGALVQAGVVDPARLPIASGTGALTDAARVSLHLVRYSDKPTALAAKGA